MTIRERINEKLAAYRVAQEVAEQTKKEAQRALSALYEQGLPQALELQDRALSELGRIGIIKMIEEFTGEPIFDFRHRGPIKATSTSDKLPYQYFYRYVSDWSADMLPPKMEDSGKWEDDLVIVMTRNKHIGTFFEKLPFREGGRDYHDFEHVLLTFKRSGEFLVNGSQRLSYYLKDINEEKLAEIEDAIADALLLPIHVIR